MALNDTNKDNPPRWQQRLFNYSRALAQLQAAVKLANTRDLTELEKQGLIKSFEFTHELSWNVMKDYFLYQGNTNITGSRDAVREAFQQGLITDGEHWMAMINSRNQTSHTYNQTVANKIITNINSNYVHLFEQFSTKMHSLLHDNN